MTQRLLAGFGLVVVVSVSLVCGLTLGVYELAKRALKPDVTRRERTLEDAQLACALCGELCCVQAAA